MTNFTWDISRTGPVVPRMSRRWRTRRVERDDHTCQVGFPPVTKGGTIPLQLFLLGARRVPLPVSQPGIQWLCLS